MSPADRLRRELERIRTEVAEEQARHIRALAELRIREVRTETELDRTIRAGKISTVKDSTQQPTSRGGAISQARSTLGTRFQMRLHERGLSVPEWVASKGRRAPSVEQVRSWSKPRDNGGRAVPRSWADELAEEFEDPDLALPSSWPAGIRS